MMNAAKAEIIFEIIVLKTAEGGALEILRFLRESITGQRHAAIHFGNLHANSLSIWRAHLGRTQHGILCEQLSIDFCDQKIVAAFIAAPDLAGLDRLNHELR